jgi:purine-binding chemotaxis protein CheW
VTITAQPKMESVSQFLTFMLGDEEYGVDILRVQEIRGWEPVSRVPNVPAYEKGVINLRGAIVPIVDLRERFALPHTGYTPLTVVIVLQVLLEDRKRVVGFVVDQVSDVVDVTKEITQPTPEFGTGINTRFLRGLATVGQRMIMLLDIDRVFGSGGRPSEGIDDVSDKY